MKAPRKFIERLAIGAPLPARESQLADVRFGAGVSSLASEPDYGRRGD